MIEALQHLVHNQHMEWTVIVTAFSGGFTLSSAWYWLRSRWKGHPGESETP